MLVGMASARSVPAPASDSPGRSTARVRAWPSLSQAAQMLGLSLSALSRTMDARSIPKHRLGRRARKIEPIALLDLAVEYGADVAKVADEAMTIAESSGVSEPVVATIEQEMGAWFAQQAAGATGPHEDRLSALIEAMRQAIGPETTQAIIDRAGIKAPVSAVAAHAPSVLGR